MNKQHEKYDDQPLYSQLFQIIQLNILYAHQEDEDDSIEKIQLLQNL